MTWLAVGATALLLGYLVYRYARPARTEKKHDAANPQAIETSITDDNTRDSSSQPSDPLPLPRSSGQVSAGNSRTSGAAPTTGPKARLGTSAVATKNGIVQNGRGIGPLSNGSANPNLEPPRLKPPTFSSMPPPPRPTNGTALRPPPSAASMLRVPPTKVLSNTSMAPSSVGAAPSKPSRKVILAPGHSPLDWAMLTAKPDAKLRGRDVPDTLIRVPPSQLRYHNGRKGRDAWTEYQGKVYNITPYLPFHPGGESELMKGAGRDAAKLFMEVHPWVNWEGILAECLVGILVSEGENTESATTNKLDEMD
jgi:cytochrome b involved in lipid metabolism